MAYATVDDMISRFGDDEIEDIAPGTPPTGIDESKIAAVIADAESEINSYLAQRYHVPLGSPPMIIVSACCDIARYRLYAVQATDEINQRYKDRIVWLKAIAKGEASLGTAERAGLQNSIAVATTSGGANRIFTRDTLADY